MESIQISKKATNNFKGLACLLIVAHHYCSWMMGKGYGNWIINFIGVRGGVMGVTIFFFLSAWGLSESQIRNMYPLGLFIKRRLSKVYFPLIISSFIYYLYLLYTESIRFNPTYLFLNVLNIKLIDVVLWFCNTILIFYLIFYVSFLPKKNSIKVSICFIATIIYSVLSTIIFPNSPFYVYSIVGFPFGMVCSLYKERVPKLSFSGSWIILSSSFLLLGALLFPIYNKLFLMNFYSFLMLVFFLIITQRIHFSKETIILSFIGVYSYEIYLLHNKVLIPIGRGGHIIWYPLAFILIVIPLSILLNKLINVIMRK